MASRTISRPALTDSTTNSTSRAYLAVWSLLTLTISALMLIPAALGHPLIYADNINQNVPLHYLASRIELTGHLPVWNIYSWSGTPLLAGFNVQTFFPLSWLFLALSPTWAFSAYLVIIYSITGGAVIKITKEFGGSASASALAATSFCLGGAFIAQIVHLDMIAGIAAIVWSVYSILKISVAPDVRAAFRWVMLLAASFALCVFAGAPEAMLDGAILLVVLTLALARYAKIAPTTFIFLVGLAALLALGISAIQWIPGLAFQHISNRNQGGYTFYSSGPYQPQSLILMLFPFLEGGSGIFNQPNYFGPYNLGEIGSYLSVLVASLGLVGLLAPAILRGGDRRINTLKAAGVVSLILALGAYTPLAPLMYHVPLYGNQRLPSRNLFGFDLMLCVVAGLTWDRFQSRRAKITATAQVILASIAIVPLATLLLYFVDGHLLFQLLDVLPASGNRTTALSIYVVVSAIEIFATAFILLYVGRQNAVSNWWKWVLIPIFIVEIALYSLSTSYAQVPGKNQYFANSRSVLNQIALLPTGGRFGNYNPNLFAYQSLANNLSTDSNVYQEIPSVQGYSSLSLGNYDSLTRSHYLDSLSLPALNPVLHDLYNLDLLNTSPLYFFQGTGRNLSLSAPKAPPVSKASKGYLQTGGYFGKPRTVTTMIVAPPVAIPSSCLTGIGLIKVAGGIDRVSSALATTTANGDPVTSLSFATDAPSVGYLFPPCLSRTTSSNAGVGVRIITTSGTFDLTGAVQAYITPKLWRFVSYVGGVSTFTSTSPKTQLFYSTANTSITSSTTDITGRSVVKVASNGLGAFTWNQNYAPGWYALVQSGTRISKEYPTEVPGSTMMRFATPPGDSTIRTYYNPPGLREGIYVTLASAIVVALLCLLRLKGRKGNASKRGWVPSKVSLDSSDLRRL